MKTTMCGLMAMFCVSGYSFASSASAQDPYPQTGGISVRAYSMSELVRGESELALFKKGISMFDEAMSQLSVRNPNIYAEFEEFRNSQYTPSLSTDCRFDMEAEYTEFVKRNAFVTDASAFDDLIEVCERILKARLSFARRDERYCAFEASALKQVLAADEITRTAALKEVRSRGDREEALNALRYESERLEETMGALRKRLALLNECRSKRLFLEQLKKR